MGVSPRRIKESASYRDFEWAKKLLDVTIRHSKVSACESQIVVASIYDKKCAQEIHFFYTSHVVAASKYVTHA